jgi:hypothetical protein
LGFRMLLANVELFAALQRVLVFSFDQAFAFGVQGIGSGLV